MTDAATAGPATSRRWVSLAALAPGVGTFIPRGSRLESRRGGRMPVLLGLVLLAAGLFIIAVRLLWPGRRRHEGD